MTAKVLSVVIRNMRLTPNSNKFLTELHQQFNKARLDLLQARQKHPRLLQTRPETKSIRDSAWTVASAPGDLQKRNVEITGLKSQLATKVIRPRGLHLPAGI